MKDATPRKPRSTQRTLLTVLCVVLAVILLLLILGTVYIETKFGKMGREENRSTLSPEQIEDMRTDPNMTAGTVPGGTAELIEGENVINILLVGADGNGERSDTMMLCTIHREEKTVTLTSFLRDSYVDIPDYFPHKMNTSYALGGFDLLNKTLEANFGVQVDGNVGVDFDSFVEVIDAVGGVDVELTYDEVDYLNGYFNWDLTEGMNHLDGEQALHYSRIRSIDGDMYRASRQRNVITALIDKARSMSLLEINDLLDVVLPMITTNMSNSQIVRYALELAPIVSDVTISTQQIPAEGTYHLDWVEQDGGMSIIWIDDFDANIDILREIMSD